MNRLDPGPTSETLLADLHGFTNEERLRIVLAAVRAGVWEMDFVGGRPSWSREMYDIYGCDPASPPAVGAEFIARFVHPEDRQRTEGLFTAIFTDPALVHFDHEYRAVRADGAVIWIATIGHVRRSATGQPIYMIGIHRDITARRRAELARMENAEFIQRIAAVAPDPVYVFDLDEQQRIYGNRTLTELLGYGQLSPPEDTARARDTMHPADLDAVAAFRRTVLTLRDHEVAEIQCRHRHADGTWRWILVRNSVFARKADGRVYQIVGTSVDITEHKAAEEELRRLNTALEERVAARTAELTAANRELESFVHSVSHDLRAPLRSIDGFCKLLLTDFGEQIGHRARELLERIAISAAKLHELMDALLALSRASSGELTLASVNLSELASTIAAELQRHDPARDVQFVIVDHINAAADRALMRIVFENLLENAWKFTRERSHARIEFGVNREDEALTYFIKDDGIGFDMAQAEHVFAPFKRLHDEAQFPGTGIGLATVQRIVARHGGRIWVESSSGRGATFFFTLGAQESR